MSMAPTGCPKGSDYGSPPNFGLGGCTDILAVRELPHAHPAHRRSSAAADARCKVSLIPTHNLVLAMHCAKWFKVEFWDA
ncbi:hypothetical protein GSI_01980 [Ganoderma sinense ZZ0214-1]|uniref:Uncharacterized protein n=1 Tax=Ganoderma sinense ZZ0214-1 TaxID=1077348 RepID=A0A2G8SNB0_9APHY|nr:hypothetical protein GSI_01980 [Ganoderma sinense ZZ0214-1]